MKRIGVALSGGGVRGVAHIAYLKAMDEMGLRPDVISGTSSGAIAGALYAGGLKPDEIMELIQQMFSARSHKHSVNLRWVRPPGGLIASAARKYLLRLLPRKRFEELDIPLKVVATDFHSLQERVFESGELLPAVMASIALPGVFYPQLVDGRYYMDGGATNIVPFDIIRDECDLLIAIDVSLVRPNELEPSPRNADFATWAATQDALIKLKLQENPVDIVERPVFDDISTMDFRMHKVVYEQAQAYLPDFIEKLNQAVAKG